MKPTSLRSLFITLISPLLAFAFAVIGGVAATARSVVYEVPLAVFKVAKRLGRSVADWLTSTVLRFARREVNSSPSVLILRAIAFKLRLVKRERPQVCEQWRLCPSC